MGRVCGRGRPIRSQQAGRAGTARAPTALRKLPCMLANKLQFRALASQPPWQQGSPRGAVGRSGSVTSTVSFSSERPRDSTVTGASADWSRLWEGSEGAVQVGLGGRVGGMASKAH